MPRPKKSYRNLAELIAASPVPTKVTDEQIRRMVVQIILDNPDDRPDPRFARMKTKLDALRFLHEMNHVKDDDDKLSVVLAEALRDRAGQSK